MPSCYVDDDDDDDEHLIMDDEEINLVNARLHTFPDLTLSRFEHVQNNTQKCPLKKLVLRQNMISVIPCMPEEVAATLEHLDLYLNSICKIENLDNLRVLKFLDLSFNSLRSIHNIESSLFANTLRELYLINCKISVINGVNKLTNLNLLELGSNRIQRIENISHLKHLKSLYLGKNKIECIEGIDELGALRLLDLQSNRITSIESSFSSMCHITELYLGNNGLTSTVGLSSLIHLQTLDMSCNKLTVIQGIETLQNLTEFWLNGNNLSNIEMVLSSLSVLLSLHTVYLDGNPLAKQVGYFESVVSKLTTLKQLDAIQLNHTNTPIT